MRITATVTVGEVRANQQGKLSAHCLDSNRKEDGSWEVDNGFWASIAQGADAFFRGLDCSQQRKPLVKIEGWFHGYGKQQPDGTYGKGFITITKAEFVQPTNQPAAAPQAAPSAPAFQPQAPAAPAFQPQAPVAPVAYNPQANGGFGNMAPAAPVAPATQPAPAPAPSFQPAAAPAPTFQPQAPVAPAPAPAPVAPGFETPVAAPAAPVTSPIPAPTMEGNPFLSIQ